MKNIETKKLCTSNFDDEGSSKACSINKIQKN